jgi:pimeloyl-ACP methyl ester carboxylesterase
MTERHLSKSYLDGLVLADAIIPERERDAQLGLDSPAAWPTQESELQGWERHHDGQSVAYFERSLWAITDEDRFDIYQSHLEAKQHQSPDASELEASDALDIGNSVILRERLLRFPSSPLYGLPHVPPASPTPRPGADHEPPAGFHSLRLLDLPGRGDLPVDRVFTFHNGLNETLGSELFYQLAAWILVETANHGEHGVCVIRPFPGHLTRFSTTSRLAEKPFHRYLADSLELFRHYLRYMVETQWFLSAIAPRDRYATLSGARVLGTRVGDPDHSRSRSELLAEEVLEDWKRIHEASAHPDFPGPSEPTAEALAACFETLRHCLGWVLHDVDDPPNIAVIERPTVHVVGYSLGGFVAQSVFMTWPYLIASCITVCSGGALRELAPTAFAHPEEWQTLTHSLRYRLDQAMVDNLFADDEGRVLGLRPPLAEYLMRVFYEVFEQEYRSAHQSRMSEYVQRLLFIVGGNDPIVKPRSVFDAAPSEGANIIEIADISHFLSTHRSIRDNVELEQRAYWLPEVARTFARWATEAEAVYQRSLILGWRDDANRSFACALEETETAAARHRRERAQVTAAPPELPETPVSSAALDSSGALDSDGFNFVLDTMVGRCAKHHGALIILRNEIPTFMLETEYQIHRAKSLHHSEDAIRLYLDGLRARTARLIEKPPDIGGRYTLGRSTIVVIPEDADARLARRFDPSRASPSSEAPMGEFLDPEGRSPEEIRDHVVSRFQTSWLHDRDPELPGVRLFSPGSVGSSCWVRDGAREIVGRKATGELMKLAGLRSMRKRLVSRLPDCWIWLAPGGALGLPNAQTFFNDPDHPGRLRREIIELFMTYLARSTADKGSSTETNRLDPGYLAASESLIAVEISGARNNPRHRGRLLREAKDVEQVLLHTALAFILSDTVGSTE